MANTFGQLPTISIRLPEESCAALQVAVCAMEFITEPEVWPHFLSFVERRNQEPIAETAEESDSDRLHIRNVHIPHIYMGHLGAVAV